MDTSEVNELVGNNLAMDDEENPIPISGLWGDLEQSNSNMDIEESTSAAVVAENPNAHSGSSSILPAGTKKLLSSSADLKSYPMTANPKGLALIIGKKYV